ncbi:MAG: four helix bundle protein [Bacteroidota bacterium]
MHNIKELKIWNKAIELTVEIYKATEKFPKEETYGLTSQIRRAAVSIPSNISEGAGRNSNNEFRHFLSIANGSSYELQTQLTISNKLALLNDGTTETLLNKIDEIQKMNYSFQKSIK